MSVVIEVLLLSLVGSVLTLTLYEKLVGKWIKSQGMKSPSPTLSVIASFAQGSFAIVGVFGGSFICLWYLLTQSPICFVFKTCDRLL